MDANWQARVDHVGFPIEMTRNSCLGHEKEMGPARHLPEFRVLYLGQNNAQKAIVDVWPLRTRLLPGSKNPTVRSNAFRSSWSIVGDKY